MESSFAFSQAMQRGLYVPMYLGRLELNNESVVIYRDISNDTFKVRSAKWQPLPADIPNTYSVGGQKYKHVKTGGDYVMLCNATLAVNGGPVVVYGSVNDGVIWVRPEGEFYDGRFVPCE